MAPVSDKLARCQSCGRLAWKDARISTGLIVFIVLLALVLIITLGFIGARGENYRS